MFLHLDENVVIPISKVKAILDMSSNTNILLIIAEEGDLLKKKARMNQNPLF